ncbi:MAG: hypothetical protein P8N76_17080 [Pirellulaceae bacterium]|nr:hypothetical protein [Pirellulaceae bacterium]
MRPDQRPAGDLMGGFKQFGSTDFLIPGGIHPRHDQLAPVIGKEEPIFLANSKHIGGSERWTLAR